MNVGIVTIPFNIQYICRSLLGCIMSVSDLVLCVGSSKLISLDENCARLISAAVETFLRDLIRVLFHSFGLFYKN